MRQAEQRSAFWCPVPDGMSALYPSLPGPLQCTWCEVDVLSGSNQMAITLKVEQVLTGREGITIQKVRTHLSTWPKLCPNNSNRPRPLVLEAVI